MSVKWFLIAMGLAADPVFSQTLPRTSELIDQASEATCKCVNDALLNVDDEVKELVRISLSDSAQSSTIIQEFLKNASADRAAEVITQLQKFGSIDSEMSSCIHQSTSVFQNIQQQLEDLTPPEQFIVRMDFQDNRKTIQRLLDTMLMFKGCEFAQQFIRFGVELEKQ